MLLNHQLNRLDFPRQNETKRNDKARVVQNHEIQTS